MEDLVYIIIYKIKYIINVFIMTYILFISEKKD